jgi:hypothetical protein
MECIPFVCDKAPPNRCAENGRHSASVRTRRAVMEREDIVIGAFGNENVNCGETEKGHNDTAV